MYLGDSGPTLRDAGEEAKVRRATVALTQAWHRIEDERIARAFEGGMADERVGALSVESSLDFRRRYAGELRARGLGTEILAGTPRKKDRASEHTRPPRLLHPLLSFFLSSFPPPSRPCFCKPCVVNARATTRTPPLREAVVVSASLRATATMGTGKKEATRKERQGKTGDGMGNVKTKGENFYRYVLS